MKEKPSRIGFQASPSNNTILNSLNLLPNLALKRAINAFIEKHKSEFQQALMVAIEKGQVQEVHSLMSLKLDLNQSDDKTDSFLKLATVQGNPQLVEYLLQKGVPLTNTEHFTRISRITQEKPMDTTHFLSASYLTSLGKYGSTASHESEEEAPSLSRFL